MTIRFSKSILVLAASGLLGAATAFAGNGPGDGSCDGSADGTCDGTGGGKANSAQEHRQGGPAERMAGMARRLGLSLEQQVRALEMFDLQAQDREQLRAQIFEQFGDELCAQRDQHRDEFRAMLTPEQLAQHDEMLQRRDQARSQGRGGLGGMECPSDD
jgi:hypothetical protein